MHQERKNPPVQHKTIKPTQYSKKRQQKPKNRLTGPKKGRRQSQLQTKTLAEAGGNPYPRATELAEVHWGVRVSMKKGKRSCTRTGGAEMHGTRG